MKSEKVLALIPDQESGEAYIFVRRQIEQISDFGLVVRPFYLGTRTHPIRILKEALRFRDEIRSFDPDVVHAHYGTVTALFAVVFSRKPVTITFRGSDLLPSSEFSWLRDLTSRLMSQIAALFAKEIICVSEEIRDSLWWRKNDAEIILTGVDLKVFYPIDRQKAREELGWARGDKIILFNKVIRQVWQIMKVKIHGQKGEVTRNVAVTEPLVKLNTVIDIDLFCQTDICRMEISVAVTYAALCDALFKNGAFFEKVFCVTADRFKLLMA